MPTTAGRRFVTTTLPTTATTISVFASPVQGNGPKWYVHGYTTSAKAMTIAPVLLPGAAEDKHARPGSG